jgi:excisionase family DNA binding protein
MLKERQETTIKNLQLLNVNQAAHFLGVHAATIRRWAYAKRIKGVKIGVRGDWRFQKQELLTSTRMRHRPQFGVQHSVQFQPVDAYSHWVQFYEEDEALVRFIANFIKGGDVAIIIASTEHRIALTRYLIQNGYSTENSDALIIIDAQETLNSIMVNGLPNASRFFNIVGTLIAKAQGDGRQVRAFGEMVAILWEEGNDRAALKLEKLWNKLQQKYDFSLYCAYPLKSFASTKRAEAFEKIGNIHTHVFPSERYMDLTDDVARYRKIARLQQKARSLEDELLQYESARQKLDQRREDFLNATSHELKTPLTSQRAFIQLLTYEVTRNNDQNYLRYITKINEQTNKLTNLVTNLLDASKIEGGKLILNRSWFDMAQCVTETSEEIQATSGNHPIKITNCASCNVFGDRDKLSQVISNLLANAVKYSPAGEQISISLQQRGKKIRIKITDHGIGMDPENQEKIFERFYRISDENTYPGLGIGLYISSEIVKQHRGTISVNSKKGHGSTFCILLPQV